MPIAPVKVCATHRSSSGPQLSCQLTFLMLAARINSSKYFISLQVKWQIPPPEQCPASGYSPSCTAMCEADARRAAAAVQRTRQAGHSWLQTAPAVVVGPMPGSPVAGGIDGECCRTTCMQLCPAWVSSLQAGSSGLGRHVLLAWLASAADWRCMQLCAASGTLRLRPQVLGCWLLATPDCCCCLPVLTALHCCLEEGLNEDCATHCSQPYVPEPSFLFLMSAAILPWPMGLIPRLLSCALCCLRICKGTASC